MVKRLFLIVFLFSSLLSQAQPQIIVPKTWVKFRSNPILGGRFGSIVDASVVREDTAKMHMWCTWPDKNCIVISFSKLGDLWTSPIIVFRPDTTTGWENEVNHPMVIYKDNAYQMWYTGKANGRSCIGYATSKDGRAWKRMSTKPVMVPDTTWEKNTVTAAHVVWDEKEKKYNMWYAGGEPDAIGFATSTDGMVWQKYAENPVFRNDPSHSWEKTRVSDCQVIHYQGWYHMFYTGHNDTISQIGMARSLNGLTDWERMDGNPFITIGKQGWDVDGVSHPFGFIHGGQWVLWYTGRHGKKSQIGIGLHNVLTIWNR